MTNEQRIKRNKKRQRPEGGKWISKLRRLAIYLRDGFICNYCGKNLMGCKGYEVTLDHLTPYSQGGSDSEENLITSCHRCNSARGSKAVEDYATGGAIDRIQIQTKLALNYDLAQAILTGSAGDAKVECR